MPPPEKLKWFALRTLAAAAAPCAMTFSPLVPAAESMLVRSCAGSVAHTLQRHRTGTRGTMRRCGEGRQGKKPEITALLYSGAGLPGANRAIAVPRNQPVGA